MIDIPGEARAWTEMDFAASLVPCPGCGSFDLGDKFELRPSMMGTTILAGPCPHCGAERAVRFRHRFESGRPCVDLSRVPTPPAHHLGGPEPSCIIRPAQFVAEAGRLALLSVPTPEQLAPAAWRKQWEVNARLMTCLTELLKFIPDDADRIPDAAFDTAGKSHRAGHPEKYTRAWITSERDRVAALIEAYRCDAKRVWAQEAIDNPPKVVRGALTARTVWMHEQWIRRGRTGEGRLDIANVSMKGIRVGAVDMSGARLEGVIFDNADISFAKFDGAELTDVKMIDANAADCSFDKAHLMNCDLLHACVAIARFEDAMIVGCRFDIAQLDRCSFRRAQVGGTSFRKADIRNSALDRAIFTDCDLRGACFSLRTKDLLGTTHQTLFERCDLRDTMWDERELDNASFIDCKLHGISGRPNSAVGVVIERPDLSPAGDGSAICGDVDVMTLWMGDGAWAMSVGAPPVRVQFVGQEVLVEHRKATAVDAKAQPERAALPLRCAACNLWCQAKGSVVFAYNDDDHYAYTELGYAARMTAFCRGCATLIRVELRFILTRHRSALEHAQFEWSGVAGSIGWSAL
jgi:uncharacterized protein YjbI with pentapeptide repeats